MKKIEKNLSKYPRVPFQKTVPVNKELLTWAVPVNKELLTWTVLFNKDLLARWLIWFAMPGFELSTLGLASSTSIRY